MKQTRTILIFSLFFILCSPNKHNFKIVKKDNIEIAKNNSFPKFYGKENLIEINQLFTIGRENDENYIFHRPSFIGIDRQQNIFILDKGNFRIQKFDSTGKFIRSFGKKGSGPGEFLNPWQGYISARHDKLIIYDSKTRRFDIFKTSGEYVQSYRPQGLIFVYQVSIDSNGNILSLEQKTTKVKDNKDPLRQVLRLIRYNSDFTNHTTLFESNPYTRSEYKFVWDKREFMAFSSDGHIYLPSSEREKYTINVYNSYGKLIRIIQKESQLKPLSEKEIERRRKSNKMQQSLTGFTVPVPTFHPPFYNLSVNKDDRLLVVAIEKKESGLDIFDRQGQYLYRAKKTPIFGNNIIKNKVYAFSLEKGFPQLNVYKIIYHF